VIRKYSTALGSSPDIFKKKGIFDGFTEIDTKLYIDPYLLTHSSAKEIRAGGKKFKKYFADTIKIFNQIKRPTGVIWRNAVERLVFQEVAEVGLGYSAGTKHGSGIGPKLAEALAYTAHEIIAAGIKDPEIFELIGLLEDGIGADRISDMTANIIRESLYMYSNRIAKELKLLSAEFKYNNNVYKLPFDKITQKYIILIPQDILRNLPVAYDWSGIDVVCAHNRALRTQVNKVIGNTWKSATKKVPKKTLKETLIKNPLVLKDLIERYKTKDGLPYDFDLDPLGELAWYQNALDYVDNFPLDLSAYRDVDSKKIYPLVQKLCGQFKQLVENNRLYELMYNESGKLKNERAAQLLFYGLADSYCQVNNIDMSREVNAGKGPVDFKFSVGYKARVNVEMKYSGNQSLVDGYVEQIEAYNKAEKTEYSIFLVVKTGKHDTKLRKIKDIYLEKVKTKERAPEIIIVDAGIQSSASKLKRRKTRRKRPVYAW